MCFQCHLRISDDEIYNQLTNITNKYDFDQWNTTSVNHMLFICLGYNGSSNKDLGIKIMSEFIKYLETKPEHYLPGSGVEPMYSSAEIKKRLNID